MTDAEILAKCSSNIACTFSVESSELSYGFTSVYDCRVRITAPDGYHVVSYAWKQKYFLSFRPASEETWPEPTDLSSEDSKNVNSTTVVATELSAGTETVIYGTGEYGEYGFRVEYDFSLVATLEEDSITVNVAADPAGGGTVSTDREKYPPGGVNAVLTATAASGWWFLTWNTSHEDSASNFLGVNPRTITPDQFNNTWYAHFRKEIRLVVESADENKGTVSITGESGTEISYSPREGGECQLEATPKSGWVFDHWTYKINDGTESTVDGEGSPLTYSKANYYNSGSILQTITYKAYFKADETQYTLTAESEDSSKGTVSPSSVTFSPGDSITISATPEDGYKFRYWMKGTAVASTSPIYTFSATADDDGVVFTAYFEVAQTEGFGKLMYSESSSLLIWDDGVLAE